MADQVLTRDGPVPVPMDYQVPQGGELVPLTVIATLDGTAAAAAFYATVQIIAPSGRVMGSAITSSVAAGGSATVTWFPWWRGVSGQAPPPSPVGRLWAWFDFSDASTVTLDGSGNISAILDKSGLGHNLFQTAAANRPGQAVVNGLAAGLFDSSKPTVLSIPAVADPLPQPYTTFVVFTQDVAAAGINWPGPLGGTGSPSPNPNFFINNTNNLLVMQQGGQSITMPGGAPFTQTRFTGIFHGASSFFRNNATQQSGTVDVDPVTDVAVGAQQFPFLPGENDGLSGKVCEVLYYYGALTPAQMLGVEAYLQAKWATP